MRNINNVVLYAKNFYVHSDNLIDDMFKMVQKDHPEINIKDKSHLVDIMMTDYKDWFERYMKEYEYAEPKVYWDDLSEEECIIYGILTKYSCFIKIHDSELEPPVYSDEPAFRPQLRLSPDHNLVLFNKFETVDEWNTKVRKFFNMTREERFDIYAKKLKENIDHSKLKELSYKLSSELPVYSVELFDSMVSELKAVTENCQKRGHVFNNGLLLSYSPNSYLDFDVYPFYFEFKMSNEGNFHNFIKSCLDEVYSALNEDFYYKHRDMQLDYSYEDSLKSLESCIDENKYPIWVSTGYVTLQVFEDTGLVRIMLKITDDCSEITAVENSLHNMDRCIIGAKL